MTNTSWIFLLNILKILGVLVGAIAGVISTLVETKTEDHRLTRNGKVLLTLSIIGFTVALSAQVVEWMKASVEEQASQARNAAILSEIRRAVTRFETISLEIRLALPVKEPAFKLYMSDLNGRVKQVFEELASAGDEVAGIRVILSKPGTGPEIFRVGPDSPALPNERRHGLAGEYFRKVIPRVALYKRPIDPKTFEFGDPTPDLSLVPTEGNPSFRFVLHEGETLDHISLDRKGMEAPSAKWSPSGALVSLEDLAGGQAIIYLGSGSWELFNLWKASKLLGVTMIVNYQRISFDMDRVSPGRDKHGDLVYSYVFPTTTALMMKR